MKTDDSIIVTTIVDTDPQSAIFTDNVDLWWKRGHRYRPSMEQGGTEIMTSSGIYGTIGIA